MIVCQCQAITDRDIHAAIDWMRSADDMTLITPGRVYRALGKAPDCGDCVRLFLATMRTNPNVSVPPRLLTPTSTGTAKGTQCKATAKSSTT